MARGLPVLVTTRSGEVLGKKIASALNEVMKGRINKITDTLKEHSNTRNARYTHEHDRIEQIREHNREQFHDRWGEFGIRPVLIEDFSDGEPHIVLANYRIGGKSRITNNSVRGKDVFAITSPYEPPESIDSVLESLGDSPKPEQIRAVLERERKKRTIVENLFETLLLCYTLDKNGADSVTLVSPYYPGARQDHSREREASTAKMIANMIQGVGVKGGICVDMHSAQIAEFFDIPVENLRASTMLMPKLKELAEYDPAHTKGVVIASPDAGGAERARAYAKRWGCDVVICTKERDYKKSNTVEKVTVIGEVKDKVVVLIDDIIDTAGTLMDSLIALKDARAKKVIAGCSHGVLSGPAIERIDKLYAKRAISYVVVTDSVTRPASFGQTHKWYHEVSIQVPLAETIYQLTMERSVGNVHEGTGSVFDVAFDKHE